MNREPAPGEKARLSVNLPARLTKWVRARAQGRGTSISAVIQEALEKLRGANGNGNHNGGGR